MARILEVYYEIWARPGQVKRPWYIKTKHGEVVFKRLDEVRKYVEKNHYDGYHISSEEHKTIGKKMKYRYKGKESPQTSVQADTGEQGPRQSLCDENAVWPMTHQLGRLIFRAMDNALANGYADLLTYSDCEIAEDMMDLDAEIEQYVNGNAVDPAELLPYIAEYKKRAKKEMP